ncbi:MAG: DNA polymerase IV [Promethearchaeota archaeon]
MGRIILHLDLDCFFAAVEARDNPEYKDKPLIVGADPKEGKGRGVVSTCSYEARKFGIHSAMPISKAYRLCSHAIFVRPNYEKYKEASEKVMEIIQSYSSAFQRGGIDEAYLDISKRCSNFKHAKNIAEQIQQEIHDKIGVTCSIGCAPTKSLAKIASDYNKPNGITVVEPEPENIKSFLKDMDITRIPGIGKKTKKYYNEKGIHTIEDIFDTPLPKMIEFFGKYGKWVWQVAHGLDTRPVKEYHNRKSISKERTFHQDIADVNNVLATFESLNGRIHENLRNHKIYYRTVTLKIRFEGFETFTRSKSVPHPIQDEKKAMRLVCELLKEFLDEKRRIRLVGIRFSNLHKNETTKQTTILNYLCR